MSVFQYNKPALSSNPALQWRKSFSWLPVDMSHFSLDTQSLDMEKMSRLEKMTHIDAQSGKLFPPLEGRIWAKGRLLYRVSLFATLLSYYQATDTSETQTNPLKTAACTLPEDNPHKHALIIRRIWLIAKNLREKWCWHNEAFFVYGFTNSYSISTNCKYTKEIF